MPASEISDDPRPALDLRDELARALALVGVVVGDQSRPRDAEPLVEQPGAPRVLAGDEVGLGQRPSGARAEVLQVPDRSRADGEPAGHQPRLAARARSPRSPSSPAPIMPASGPSSAATTRVAFIGGRARVRSCSRAGSSSRSPAAATPPPITITSGSKMFARLESATPSRRPISRHDLDRDVVAVDRAARSPARPSISLALGAGPAERRVGVLLGGQATLAAERGARGERLDAAAVGAVALAGRPRVVDDDVAELGARRRSSRERPRRRGSSPPPMPVPIVSITTSPAPRATPSRCSASAATLASLSTYVGRPRRSPIRSRIGTSTIGRFTELTATPRVRSIVRRDAEADRLDVGMGLERLSQLRLELGEQVRGAAAGGGRERPVKNLAGVVDDPDRHLRPAEVDADRDAHGDVTRNLAGRILRGA